MKKYFLLLCLMPLDTSAMSREQLLRKKSTTQEEIAFWENMLTSYQEDVFHQGDPIDRYNARQQFFTVKGHIQIAQNELAKTDKQLKELQKKSNR